MSSIGSGSYHIYEQFEAMRSLRTAANAPADPGFDQVTQGHFVGIL